MISICLLLLKTRIESECQKYVCFEPIKIEIDVHLSEMLSSARNFDFSIRYIHDELSLWICSEYTAQCIQRRCNELCSLLYAAHKSHTHIHIQFDFLCLNHQAFQVNSVLVFSSFTQLFICLPISWIAHSTNSL